MIIVSVEQHNRAEDLLVALITSKIAKARRRGEYVLKRWAEIELKEESAIRPRLFQIVKSDVISRLGSIQSEDRPGMVKTLKGLLGI